MRAVLTQSAGPRGMHTNRFGMTWLPTVLVAGAVACGGGRIPGLIDAAARAPAGADALPDARRAPDLAIGRGGAGANLGGAGGAAGTTVSCTEVVLSTASRQPADVLLVLDRSGSMNYSITEECACDSSSNPAVRCPDLTKCTTRWSSLATALDNSLSSTPFVHWGLKLFMSPNALPCEVVSGVEVPLGAGTAPAIQAEIAAITPAGETPTAAAIAAATAYLEAVADTNSKVMLLVTDGKPNCAPSVYDDDVAGTIEAIRAAFAAGFLVYVVGVGTGATVANLDSFAQAGGTGAHYSAQSPDGLARALGSIGNAATCTFALDAIPANPDWVGVYIDKTMIPRDASNGWSFGPSSQIVLLHGSFCDQSLSGTLGVVEALFGCGQPLPPVLP